MNATSSVFLLLMDSPSNSERAVTSVPNNKEVGKLVEIAVSTEIFFSQIFRSIFTTGYNTVSPCEHHIVTAYLPASS